MPPFAFLTEEDALTSWISLRQINTGFLLQLIRHLAGRLHFQPAPSNSV